MPTWTAERDQRLLLLIVENVKVDGPKLAAAYKAKYGAVDDYEPTPRAITEHIFTLKKAAAGGIASAKSTPMKHPRSMTATPKKNSAVKTPTSSVKRSRKIAMSEEDDDDDDESETERKMPKVTPTHPRASLSRRSKSVTKSYHEDDQADDESDVLANGHGGDWSSNDSTEVKELDERLDKIPFKLPTAVLDGQLTPDGKVVGAGKANVPADGFESDGSNFSGDGFGLGY